MGIKHILVNQEVSKQLPARDDSASTEKTF